MKGQYEKMKRIVTCITVLLTVLCLFSAYSFVCSGADMSGGYQSICLDVPFFCQRKSGDCGISSIAMVEAYKKGYGTNDTTAYNAVYNYNGNSVFLASYGNLGYTTISNDLSAIYTQLQHDNPVIVYRTGSGKDHYSVIYGYNGSSTTLEKKGFLVLNTWHNGNYTIVNPGTIGYTDLETWLSGATWTHTMIRTGNPIPLADKNNGSGNFNEVWASNLGYSNAQVNAKIPYQWITSAGIYIGQSTSNMTQIVENIEGGMNVDSIWYDLNEWYGTLTKNTRYYYRFFYVNNGTTYTSKTYSFYTGYEDNASEPQTLTCDYRVTIPANYTLTCYWNATDQTASERYISAKTESYRLKCDQQVTLPSGVVRYRFTSSDGYTLYFTYDSNAMSLSVNHDYSTISHQKATCITSGIKVQKCDNCGEERTETLPATGKHTAGEWELLREAACTDAGIQVQRCSVCGTTVNTEALPAVGHDYTSSTVDATCIEDGKTTHTCKNCGDTYSDPIPATGNHSLSDWQVTAKATCTATGTKIQSCSVCGATVNTESLPAVGHDYTSSTVDATCIEDGKTTHTCKNCGDSYSDPIPATGHRYSSITTEATCSKEGKIVYTCKHCEHSYTKTIPPTGKHTFGSWAAVSASMHKRFCTVCQISEEASHRWDQGTITLAPTETQNGIKTYTCSDCSSTREERISPLSPTETTVASDSETATEVITTEENESETIPVTTESIETDNVVPPTDYIESTTDTIDVIETEPDDVTASPIESAPFSDEETYTPRPTETTNAPQTDGLNETPVNRALMIDVIIFAIGMIGCGIAFLLSKRNRR